MSSRRLLMCADLINANYSDYSLLDLGCRTMDLKPLLGQGRCKEYYGSDFVAGEDVYECNLEEGLPQFKDGAFDIVTALDVLEHLENAHNTFKEALRVAKKAVFVSLPNMYYIEFRLRFLLGGKLSGKYLFPAEPVMDRHRWILSYEEAVEFVTKNAAGYEVEVFKIPPPQRGRSRVIAEPLEARLAHIWPELFAYGVLFMINKS